MDTLIWNLIHKSRDWRDQKFQPLGKFLHKHGLTANRMTFFGLCCGIVGAYFLGINYYLFLLFLTLHLLADALDGIIARASQPTLFGEHFDHIIADSSITWLLLLKVAYNTQDYYAWIIAGLFALTVMVYSLSRLQSPFLPVRTGTVLLLVMQLFTLSYLLAGAVALFNLARQVQWYVQKESSNSRKH